jgi:cation transport ATPase
MKKAISDQLHEKFLIERKSVYEKFPTVFYEEGTETEATVSANEKIAADRVVEFRKRIPEIATAEEAHRKVSRIITISFLFLLLLTVGIAVTGSMKIQGISFLMMIASALVMLFIAWLSITERFFVSKNSKKTQSPTFDLEHLVATDILADFGIGEEYLEEE